jgi:hypothetical protein
LVDQLRGAVDGRHLLAWSPHATQQRAWRAAGVSGALRPDSLMVSAMNFGGSKVDQYLAIAADLQVQPGATGTDVRLTMVDGELDYTGQFPLKLTQDELQTDGSGVAKFSLPAADQPSRYVLTAKDAAGNVTTVRFRG